MRTFSFCQESTRYCNYSKDKFGNELTFILPSWIDRTEEEANEFLSLVASGAMMNEEGKNTYPFYNSLKMSEYTYLQLLENGWTPQQARQVLPNALKTEICVCGFEDAWQHFFELRCSPHAHPSMQEVANMAKEMFIQCKYITEDA